MHPKVVKARLVHYAMAPKVEEELDHRIEADVIEPVAYSDWVTPIFPVLKLDGRARICGDYKLTANQAIKINHNPTPCIEDLYAKLSGGQKFTTLDLKHVYNKVNLEEMSREVTTINTHPVYYW